VSRSTVARFLAWLRARDLLGVVSSGRVGSGAILPPGRQDRPKNGYVALLRGINVGSGPRIGMVDLRELVSGLGWSNVQTYLQSGNVVFAAGTADSAALAAQLETAVAGRFPVRPQVVVLTRDELAAVSAGNPFPDEAAAAPKTVHALVLAVPAGPAVEARAAAAQQRAVGRASGDRAVVAGRAVYLNTPDGIGRSELAAALSRPGALGDVVGTARNWSTVRALLHLCDAAGR